MARYARRSSGGPTERGVSTVVGVALLIGMVVTGALLVFFLGSSLLTDIQQQGQIEVAEQSFRESASQIDELRSGDTERAVLALPERDGELNVSRETVVRVTANRNRSCTTGPVTVGTLVYENEAGEQVGYELGGVWRSYDNGGSSMVSAPAVEYRDGRLSLSLSDFEGLPGGEDVSARLNRTGSQNLSRYLMEGLITNKTVKQLNNPGVYTGPTRQTCFRRGVDNVTFHVNNSRFANAWHQFATRNFGDREVDVYPTGTVTAGENVSIYFEVGPNVQTEMEVDDVRANSSVPEDQQVLVNATIRNSGELTGGQDLTLEWYDRSTGTREYQTGPSSVSNPVVVESKDRRNVTFAVPASELDNGGGPSVTREYVLNVTTEDDEMTANVTVGDDSRDAPTFRVTDIRNLPDDAELSDNVTFQADIQNDAGTFTATKDVVFKYDGTVVERRPVTLASGANTTLEFYKFPTAKKPNIPVNISTEDDYRVETIDVGDSAYLAVDDSTAPSSISVGSSITVDVVVNNTGSLEGDQDLDIIAQNTSSGSIVDSGLQDITVPGGTKQTFSLTAGSFSNAGRYNYTVETDDDTSGGNFYVGTSASTNFVVSSVSGSDRVQQGGELTLSATVANTGSTNGTETLQFTFNGTTYATESVSIPAGTTKTVTRNYTVPSGKAPDEYTASVGGSNTGLRKDVRVYDPTANPVEDDGNILRTNQTVEARLQILGTALTGYQPGNYVIRDPIEMAFYTENSSAGSQYHYLWGRDTDLNTPSFRERQINDDPFLSKTITVSANTNISVFAESFFCDGYAQSGYRIVESQYVRTYKCADWGGSRIPINQNENTNNLVILEDGDDVPAFQQANEDQRNVTDMLQDKVGPSGTLDLAANEYVLLYELSEESADPENADDSDEDPDYNDAVVLFETLGIESTVTTPADFEIVDTTAPAQATGGTPQFEVTVNNTGGTENSTTVRFEMNNGYVAERESPELDTGEKATLSFDIPTSSGTIPNSPSLPDTFPLDAEIVTNGDDSAQRNIYIGTTPKPYFVPNPQDVPRAVEAGSTFDFDVTVENVGGSAGTQRVWRNVTAGPSVANPENDQSVTLSVGGRRTETFTVDTSSSTGTLTIDVATANVTDSVQVVVDERNFVADRVIVGPENFEDGDTITTTNITSMDVVVDNDAAVPGTSSVEMDIESQHDSSVDTTLSPAAASNRPLSLDGNEAKVVNFDLPSGVDVGTYDYTIDTGDDTISGKIQVVSSTDPSVPVSATDDVVAIDGNVIVLGG